MQTPSRSSARTFGGWRFSQRGVACSGEGIEPAQTREPDELAVGGVQDSAVFDSESGYLSVGHEVARSAEVFEKLEASTSRSSANWFKLPGSIPGLNPIGLAF